MFYAVLLHFSRYQISKSGIGHPNSEIIYQHLLKTSGNNFYLYLYEDLYQNRG